MAVDSQNHLLLSYPGTYAIYKVLPDGELRNAAVIARAGGLPRPGQHRRGPRGTVYYADPDQGLIYNLDGAHIRTILSPFMPRSRRSRWVGTDSRTCRHRWSSHS